jgi:ComF family protein
MPGTGIAVATGAIRAFLGGLGDLLLPAACSGCASRRPQADGLCEECTVRLLSLVALPYCPRCGATLGPHVPAAEDGCRECPDPLPRFGQVVRLGPYAEPLRGAVRQIKYRRQDTMRHRLGDMLGQAVAARGDGFDLVMPVPMHWRRRLVRGYDHARMLAHAVGKAMALPVGDELVRVRHTPPQANLPRSRRAENVRGAFKLASRAAINGAAVLLIDDVTTTGATGNEATRTLLAGGASRVALAVIAKADPPRAYAQDSRQ